MALGFALAAPAVGASRMEIAGVQIPAPGVEARRMTQFLNGAGVAYALDLRPEEMGRMVYELGAAGVTAASLQRNYPDPILVPDGIRETLSARAGLLIEERRPGRDAPENLDAWTAWRQLFDGTGSADSGSLQPATRKLLEVSPDELLLAADMRRIDSHMSRGFRADSVRLSPGVTAQNARFVDQVVERLRRGNEDWVGSRIRKSNPIFHEQIALWLAQQFERLERREKDLRDLSSEPPTVSRWNQIAESTLLAIRGLRGVESWLARGEVSDEIADTAWQRLITAWEGPQWREWTGEMRRHGGEILFTPVKLGWRFFTDAGGIDVYADGLSLFDVWGDGVLRSPEQFAAHDALHASLRSGRKLELMRLAHIDAAELRNQRAQFLAQLRSDYAQRPVIERANLEFTLSFIEQELGYPIHPLALKAYAGTAVAERSPTVPVDRTLPTVEFVLELMKYRVLHAGGRDLNMVIGRRDFREAVIRKILNDHFVQS